MHDRDDITCPSCGRTLAAGARCTAWRCNRQPTNERRDREILRAGVGVLRAAEEIRAEAARTVHALAQQPITTETPAAVLGRLEAASAPFRQALGELAKASDAVPSRAAEERTAPAGGAVELVRCSRCGVYGAPPCDCDRRR